jgi:uncharacterized membrane protein YeaQ/YmgE (transglycosylase-associated protein family)
MSLFWTILIGFSVGLVARLLMPGRHPGGVVITTVLGCLGALVAQWTGQALKWYATGDPASFVSSLLGAVVLLAVYRLFLHRAFSWATGGSDKKRAAGLK